MKTTGFIFSVILIFAPTALLAESYAKVTLSDQSKPKGPSYLCKLGKLIWNQEKPCDQDTPIRREMLARYKANQPKIHPLLRLREMERDDAEARVAQVKNYPDQYYGKEITIENIWLHGQVTRSYYTALPEGQNSILTIEDVYGERMPVVTDEKVGLRFSGELRRGLKYEANHVKLIIEDTQLGPVAFLEEIELVEDGKKKFLPEDVIYSDNPSLTARKRTAPHQRSAEHVRQEYQHREQGSFAPSGSEPFKYEHVQPKRLPDQGTFGLPESEVATVDNGFGNPVDSTQSQEFGVEQDTTQTDLMRQLLER